MGNILVIGEHQEGKVKKVTQELVAKASELAGQLGGEVDVVLVGHGLQNAGELGQFGAKKVYTVDNPKLEKYNTEGYVKVIADLCNEVKPSVILGTASTLGRDLLPRLSARLNAGLASDCTDLKTEGGKLVATRPIYSGKAFVDVKFEGDLQMASARPNSFVAKTSGSGAAEVVSKDIDPGTLRATIKEIVKGKSDKADLTEASIIVSGGRAMKSADNFKILTELADTIGATVGRLARGRRFRLRRP
jgi:electron transfer flavoprotein alpha subunit